MVARCPYHIGASHQCHRSRSHSAAESMLMWAPFWWLMLMCGPILMTRNTSRRSKATITSKCWACNARNGVQVALETGGQNNLQKDLQRTTTSNHYGWRKPGLITEEQSSWQRHWNTTMPWSVTEKNISYLHPINAVENGSGASSVTIINNMLTFALKNMIFIIYC